MYYGQKNWIYFRNRIYKFFHVSNFLFLELYWTFISFTSSWFFWFCSRFLHFAVLLFVLFVGVMLEIWFYWPLNIFIMEHWIPQIKVLKYLVSLGEERFLKAIFTGLVLVHDRWYGYWLGNVMCMVSCIL